MGLAEDVMRDPVDVRHVSSGHGGVINTEDEKRRERGQAVGLFRYHLICPDPESVEGELFNQGRARD
ncbi:hypothetical protein [[Mycobacterium] burgundiense]|uniref:Uncharacterized protein n=1 Tax=[Mycobacterium] burgundiense TaxID=3064286 RepID=A0ABM9LPZ6_9MYCO|nr:hypothetical protein [Mycolicibacterium sp. MU0053]CAJ1502725.1 hypothetical protein MU0053_002258 [Mycolicibacterium sp. MU0053]